MYLIKYCLVCPSARTKVSALKLVLQLSLESLNGVDIYLSVYWYDLYNYLDDEILHYIFSHNSNHIYIYKLTIIYIDTEK